MRRGHHPVVHTIPLVRYLDDAAIAQRLLEQRVRAALRGGAQHIALDLRDADHLDDRACRAIRDVFTTIQEHQTPGARAKLVLAGVNDAQLELLRAARLTNCIPVERRTPAPLTFTSEIEL